MTTILKLGGSIITQKAVQPPVARVDVLTDIMQGLAVAVSHSQDDVVLIHGAGSYGHAIAAAHALVRGVCGDAEKRNAAKMCQSQVATLHEIVMTAAIGQGIPVRSIKTHEVIVQTAGHISSFDMSPIHAARGAGYIPVLYGDVVPDTEWEYSICSGDTIAAHLATSLGAFRLVFASDIDGIYTADPHLYGDAILLQEILVEDIIEESIAGIGPSHHTDVTGGLYGKLQSFAHMMEASQLKEVIVYNGLQKDRLLPALMGTLTYCTKIYTSRTV